MACSARGLQRSIQREIALGQIVKTRDGTGRLSTLSGEGTGSDSAIGWPPTHPGGRIETMRRREGRERGLPGETPLAGQVWPGCLLSVLDPVAPADAPRIKQHAPIDDRKSGVSGTRLPARVVAS